MSPTRISANRAPDALGRRRERSPLGGKMDSAPEAHNALSVFRNETHLVRPPHRTAGRTQRTAQTWRLHEQDDAPSGAAPRTRRLRLHDEPSRLAKPSVVRATLPWWQGEGCDDALRANCAGIASEERRDLVTEHCRHSWS